MSSRVMTEFRGILSAILWAFALGAAVGAWAVNHYSDCQPQPAINVDYNQPQPGYLPPEGYTQ